MSNIIKAHISYDQHYDIQVLEKLSGEFTTFCKRNYPKDKIIVVIDEKVSGLHQKRIKKMCGTYFSETHFIEVPEGELSKSVSEWHKIVNKVLEIGVERRTPLLAVGGGVTGDLGGFVAASVLRGLPLIHMPTTLLAMVDSSIGGKTGVNHATGKNLIGSFYQPEAVFSDISFLKTLAQKEWITGMAEILKYAAIRKPALFAELEALVSQPLEPNEKWQNVIYKSARIKTDIVQEDTLEAGKRAFLNFGHTFGHALERAAGYGKLNHGEAVFVGMIAATHLSKLLGYQVDEIRFDPFISLYRQQISKLPSDVDELIEIMKTDKKVKCNTLRLVLLNEWGSPYIYDSVDRKQLEGVWDYTLAQFH